jgi:hypothetical protein
MATAQDLYNKRTRDKLMASLTPDTNTLYLLYIETECECCNRRTIRLMAKNDIRAMNMAWDIVRAREKHTQVTHLTLGQPDKEPIWTMDYEYGVHLTKTSN